MNVIAYRMRLLCVFVLTIGLHTPVFSRQEMHIVGGGIIGFMEAYYAWSDAQANNQSVYITIYEASPFFDTTVQHLVPSFTPDEIMSVVPRGQELVKKSQILFSQPGGIRVDDVPGIAGTFPTQQFTQEVQVYSLDEIGHALRTKSLFELGKMSMDLWKNFYETADAELRAILEASNFNPCHDVIDGNKKLHHGYRIDIIYNIPNAQARAEGMKQDYETLGYTQCAILTPAQVMELDPYLTHFCKNHASENESGELAWHNDAVALWRPGGCIDTQVFLPKFYEYLKKRMGEAFHVKFGHKVIALDFAHNNAQELIVVGLRCANEAVVSLNNNNFATHSIVLCPGESVGTLKKLGLEEPAYAGFAGASLMLDITIPENQRKNCEKFSHCMEVHQEGVVLAWQARMRDNKIFIGVAGTKAFYSDQKPTKDQAFAKNRNLLQLNMINDLLPEFISWGLGYDTAGTKLNEYDMDNLELNGVATRWAGTRAVAYDGFPTLGCVYRNGCKVTNARCTTHLGSGGVSFAHGAVTMSRCAMKPDNEISAFERQILEYAISNRTAQAAAAA